MGQISRRQFVVAGLSVLAAGCAQTKRLVTQRPHAVWPVSGVPPQASNIPVKPSSHHPKPLLHPQSVMAIPRSQWAQSNPIQSRLRAMGAISKVTVHHEGGTPVWFDDTGTTAKRLESIRKSHLKRLKAGDIGYHLVIDRAGRVWQGRDLCYQGAHVRGHNPQNIGVMVLGNFDLQRPTDAQMASVQDTLTKLVHQYRIPMSGIYTHQELNITSCPGKALQRNMVALRSA